MRSPLRRGLLALVAGAVLLSLLGAPSFTASAQPVLTLLPDSSGDSSFTFNVVGLDSNDVNVGPDNFPVGARLCNTGDAPATNVVADFIWDSSNAFVNLRPGSLDPITLLSLAAGDCVDLYFEVTISRNAAAYDTTRRYHIQVASDQTGPISTPIPRELYVEHLISQSRNSTTDVLLNGVSIPAGGTMTLVVGNTYTIELDGATATNGYEQIETFINFPNTIFRINSVATNYAAATGADPEAPSKLYADGCDWEDDPNSPNYRACAGTGKYGGDVTVTYDVTIIGGGGTTQTLNTLIYDFSGSSYHYNSDFSTSARIAAIIDPASLTISKNFVPDPTNLGGVSVLTFIIANPNPAEVGGVSFSDTLPTSPGALVVASPPNASTSGCGTPTFAPTAGSGSLTFSNGTIAASSTCTIRVNVSPPAAGTYTNTSGNLFVGTTDTGDNASDTLTVNTVPVPPACTPGLELARWTMEPSQGTGVPPNPSFQSGRVASAAAAFLNGTSNSIYTGPILGTQPLNYWNGVGWAVSTATPDPNVQASYQFTLDTSNFTGVAVSVRAYPESGWASPTNNGIHIFSNADGLGWVNVLSRTDLRRGNWNAYGPVAASSTGTSTTAFRVIANGRSNGQPDANLHLDDIILTGCGVPQVPTIVKSFSPDPIAVNGVSTLTFALTNENNVALTGVQFNDSLPPGVEVATTPAASTTCGGGWAPAAGATTLTLSGGTIPARVGTTSGTCTVHVNVTATTAGPHDNVSGFISSTETGANTGPTGTASASLTAVLPPSILKVFDPNPILGGGISTLAFTLDNPNLNDALSGVAFTDAFPATMVVANPTGATTSGCGAPTYSPAFGAGSISFSGGSIAAGGTCTVTVNVTVPAAGSYVNTSGNVSHVINAATVNGNTATDTLLVEDPVPGLASLKQVGPTASGPWSSFLALATGGDVFYLLTLENIGDVPLSPVSVSDPDLDTSGCSWPVSLPVASPSNNNHIATCVVGPLSAVSGSHTNTATGHGTFGGTDYTDTSAATYATTGLTVVKTAAEPSFTAAGDVLHYSYLVTNTGSSPLAGPVSVSDDKATDEACPAVDTVGDLDAFFDPGESLTCTATYTVTAGDVTAGSVTNSAFATAAGVDSNSDTETVTYLAPPTVAKVFFPSTILAGNTSTLIITLNNPGGTDLSNVSFTDTYPAAITNAATPNPTTDCQSGTASATAGGGSVSLSGAYLPATEACTITVSVTSSTGGSHVNTIPVGGVTTDQGVSNTAAASATLTVTTNPGLNVTKAESSTGPYGVGDTITYSVVVTNTGNVTLTGVTVSDAQATVGTCTPGQPSTLGPGATMSCPASYVVTQADVDAGSFTNTATADSVETGPDTASETVTFTQVPALNVVKEVGSSGTGPWDDTSLTVAVGADVYYRIAVTNTGNVTLTGITVSDPDVDTSGCTWTDPLVVGLSASCVVGPVTALAGTHTNTATADSAETGPDTDGASYQTTGVTVTDPAVVKSGDPSTASIGDTVVFTLVITNNGNVNADNVVVTDDVPAFLTINSVVVAPAGPSVGITGTTITIDFGTVTPTVGACPPAGGTDCYVVTITTVVNSSATPPGGSNNVTLTTTSPDSDPTNNADAAAIAIVVPGLEVPETGFPPDRLTILPPQPIEESYLGYGDLRLEIPTLGVTADIVGIPQTGAGWDVSWLGRRAGYLNGTAFPTWLGNSVITAHVTLPSGEPGPFVDLKSLRFGDRVVVQAWGLRHVYEIREVDLVSPADRDVFRHEERSWLTLVTCHGFDEREATYRWRVVARAVLISIEADDSAEGSISLQMDRLTTTPRPPALPGGR